MADMVTVSTSKQFRRLAVFLDGTWDKEEGNTNVWRSKCLCASHGPDGIEQKIFYSAGVGTTLGEQLRGGIFGYGIDDVIIAAYEWLLETFEDGDEIFVFGFSRGAYTARSLSGFISRCGLIRLGAPLGVKQLYDRYRKGNLVHSIHELNEPTADATKFSLEEKWMIAYCIPVPVKFTGVWDTVGAIAKTNTAQLLTGGDHSFLDANLRKSETYVYHALAIDENRAAFDATLLSQYVPNEQTEPFTSPRPLADVEQRWFMGAHGDVGGGSYNDLLAQVPLRWLLTKASAHGLAFRRNIEIDKGAITAAVEDSFSDFLDGTYLIYELGQRHYRAIDRTPERLSRTTRHTINETIDGSVFDRWRGDHNYRPKNLSDWAGRRGVRIEDLHGSKQAADPSSSCAGLMSLPASITPHATPSPPRAMFRRRASPLPIAAEFTQAA